MSRNFSEEANLNREVGQRLVRAFAAKGITSKKEIAKKLGFKSDKAVYKVINGDQELSFRALLLFRESTGFSIDWLLSEKETAGHHAIEAGPGEMGILELAREPGALSAEDSSRLSAARETFALIARLLEKADKKASGDKVEQSEDEKET